MFTPLKTKRLHLSNIGKEDAEFFFREFSNDEVNRYLYDADPCTSVEEALEWIAFYLEEEPRDHHRWILVEKEAGEKIGTAGFHRWNPKTCEIEVGYDLYPTYWRKGYMTEALTEMIRFAKEELGVKRIAAHIFVDNLASAKTAQKLGFVKSGEQYFEVFHGEKYLHDIYILDIEGV